MSRLAKVSVKGFAVQSSDSGIARTFVAGMPYFTDGKSGAKKLPVVQSFQLAP
jgi:hypothetical protein